MKKDILLIIVSVFFAAAAHFLPDNFPYVIFSFAAFSYIIIGYKTLCNAFKGILRGDVLGESFLMSVASLGAFFIGEYTEAVAVLVLYRIGELFEKHAVNKSRTSISALMDICPDCATVIRNGAQVTVDAEEVSVGDTILIKPGERIPLDALILSGETTINTSAVTGESMPVFVREGDEVLSGCINETNALTARVTKEFEDSAASKILKLVEGAQMNKAKSERFITVFARFYTPVVVVSALLLAFIPPLISNAFTFSEQIYRALSFLVASCPCALVISIPLSFFGGIGNASKHGILVKGGNYLEALARCKTAVFDKTGTLTHGSFKVVEIKPEAISEDELLEIAAYCESCSNHPAARSILQAYSRPVDSGLIVGAEELPGYGISAIFKGKKYFVGNEKLMRLHGFCNIPANDITTVYICSEADYLGFISISDEIKADSRKTLADLKKAGIKKTVMLTGDNDSVSQRVGKELGIDEVYSCLLPQDKLDILEKLEKEAFPKGKVLFAGDGINDTPVLSRADVGISMGASGTDAAVDASDIVIMKDEPYKIVTGISIAKYTLKIVKQNIVFSLFVKFSVLILCAFGIFSMWAAVFADVGVLVLAILNALRTLKKTF